MPLWPPRVRGGSAAQKPQFGEQAAHAADDLRALEVRRAHHQVGEVVGEDLFRVNDVAGVAAHLLKEATKFCHRHEQKLPAELQRLAGSRGCVLFDSEEAKPQVFKKLTASGRVIPLAF